MKSQAFVLVLLFAAVIGSTACGGPSGNSNTNSVARDEPTPSPAPPSTLGPKPAVPSNILFIVDSSGSMNQKLGSGTKMDVAKQVVNQLVSDLPAGTRAGLMAYGHRQKNDCKDVGLLAPVGELQPGQFAPKVDGLEPLGQIPISYSIREAARVLAEIKAKKTVIQISDGEETCREDPCGVAGELNKANVDLKIHVVGFGIDKAAAKKQLTCIADATGGTYRDAASAADLKESLAGMAQDTAEGENLIENGSFEIGTDPGSFTPYNAGQSGITGWQVTASQIDYVGGALTPSDGKRSIDLDGTPGAGAIAQTFTTRPGESYVVRFDLSGNAACPPAVKKLRVNLGGQTQDYDVDTSGQNPWEPKTLRFKARSTSTRLEFASLDDPSGKCGPAIDNVRAFVGN